MILTRESAGRRAARRSRHDAVRDLAEDSGAVSARREHDDGAPGAGGAWWRSQTAGIWPRLGAIGTFAPDMVNQSRPATMP
ncbi:MAG TPA: hypothetical protein VLW50_03240 [Streptosporangiaceae bacterium]|nr:hypothetical protein [Streptosporangiaceae bacterium]